MARVAEELVTYKLTFSPIKSSKRNEE